MESRTCLVGQVGTVFLSKKWEKIEKTKKKRRLAEAFLQKIKRCK